MIIISIIASLSMQVQAMTIRDRASEFNVNTINQTIIDPMNKASFKEKIQNPIQTSQNKGSLRIIVIQNTQSQLVIHKLAHIKLIQAHMRPHSSVSFRIIYSYVA